MLKSSPAADNRVRALDSMPRSGANDASSDEIIKRLELENAQLRRLVTDMLLEKLKYEEELRARQGPRMRRPDNG